MLRRLSIASHRLEDLPAAAVGTLRYMAPECLRAEPVRVPTAIDVYAYGWVLHDCTHVGTMPAGRCSEQLSIPPLEEEGVMTSTALVTNAVSSFGVNTAIRVRCASAHH